MGFRCANCGGNILFDVDSQSMKCQHCGTMIPPDQFDVRNTSTEERVDGAFSTGERITYKAYDSVLDVPVAIKEYYPSGIRILYICSCVVNRQTHYKQFTFIFAMSS